jgi:hypothetical protein
MAKNEFFIQQRGDGRFNVLRPNADRASGSAETQADAIARTKKIDPDATTHAERVRDIGLRS